MNHKDYRRVNKIFRSVSDIEPKDRAAYLDQKCGKDASIRRKVEQLLQASDGQYSKELAIKQEGIGSAYGGKEDTELTQTLPEHQIKTQFGNYEILSSIGKGGMGEVFLALDRSLNRKVAIKVLAERLTHNNEHLQRFKQEAHAASSLNHPYILTIFEFGQNDEGRHFIVSEYVEGSTFNKFCADAGNNLLKKLDVLIRIAAALAAAHESGIIHRDIKPDNIIVRPDGYAKVLDFGLAKLIKGHQIHQAGSRAATDPLVNTMSGTVMGTASYMSPEQAKGGKIDPRTDIFSFGIVLYEAVTERLPFEGTSAMDIVATILHKEPLPINDSKVPVSIVRIITKALKKDTDERYQTMNDLLVDLKAVRRELDFEDKLEQTIEPDEQEETIIFENRRTNKKSSPYQTRGNTIQLFMSKQLVSFQTFFMILIVAVLGVLLWWFGFSQSDNTASSTGEFPNTFKLSKITNWSNTAGELSSTAGFSPDGRFVAYGSTKAGTTGIWVKQTDSGDAIQVTKDDFYNRFPVWSPNGNEIVFYSKRGDSRGLWRVSLMGGQQKLIAEDIDSESKPRFWAKSGKIYFQGKSDLFATDENTSETTKITDFGSKTPSPRIIQISPDEQKIAFLVFEDDVWRIKLRQINGGSDQVIVDSGELISNFVWHPDGERILYSRKAEGFYQIFMTGPDGSQPLQISATDGDSFIQDVSADGERILFTSITETSDLWRLKIEDGQEKLIASEIDAELWADASPDSSFVVYQSIKNLRQGSNLFSGSLMLRSLQDDKSAPLKLSDSGFLPVWSPNGKAIAFAKLIEQDLEIWRISSTGDQQKSIASGKIHIPRYSLSPYLMSQINYLSWSPNGSALAFSSKKNDISNIRLVSIDSTEEKTISGNTDKNILLESPVWSPDGSNLAYLSQTKRSEDFDKQEFSILIYDFAGNKDKSILRSDEAIRLLGWTKNSDELIYTVRKKTKTFTTTPPDVPLLAVSINTRIERPLKTLKDSYFYNIHLSPDHERIAFTSRTSGNDDVWLAALEGEESPRKLTENNDPRLYYSSLAWTPDSRSIIFGKQTRFTLLSMLTNLNTTEDKK